MYPPDWSLADWPGLVQIQVSYSMVASRCLIYDCQATPLGPGRIVIVAFAGDQYQLSVGCLIMSVGVGVFSESHGRHNDGVFRFGMLCFEQRRPLRRWQGRVPENISGIGRFDRSEKFSRIKRFSWALSEGHQGCLIIMVGVIAQNATL